MNPALTHIHDTLRQLRSDLEKNIIGQTTLLDQLLITLFAGGHALIEGVPGLGKTKMIKTLASILGYDCKRISFTPDLLPSDLTGNEIYRPKEAKFEIRKGPIFTSILLADEINRTPPKVQSALLEAMEERQVTIGNETLELPKPFFVIATQNPLEHEGTYPLPEAELDRFLMKIIIEYPSAQDEKKIIEQSSHLRNSSIETSTKITPEELIEMQSYIAENIRIDPKIYDYISALLEATRNRNTQSQNPELEYGASTRGGIALIRCARIAALLDGRDFVMPEDIKSLVLPILRHRIGLTYEALADGKTADTILVRILESVKVL